MTDERRCPYCAEPIRAEAVRCPHCRSRVAGFASESWYRDQPEAVIAGVSAALARAFSLPLVAVRVGFVVLSFVHLLGVIVYGALWLAIPHREGGESVLEGLLGRAQCAARHLSGRDCRSEPSSSRSPVDLHDNGS